MVDFNIEGLSSLRKLHFVSKRADEISIRNLPSLTKLYLIFCGEIYEERKSNRSFGPIATYSRTIFKRQSFLLQLG